MREDDGCVNMIDEEHCLRSSPLLLTIDVKIASSHIYIYIMV